eukprot:CAMPEP_0173430352 /NCGR_PEP_ID=MMETSP1357-20121228/8800_1 /TAXON_ID=77926 /ORGANISM="Hemiselmis rufescens, Strain PCC563" /LENGTH=52 /DNA_ID=CAMNT_0014394671 /DNA_START=34 /DNA_END=192 /DNA_ORIENTATION=+
MFALLRETHDSTTTGLCYGHGCFAPYNQQWYKYKGYMYAHEVEQGEPESQAA